MYGDFGPRKSRATFTPFRYFRSSFQSIEGHDLKPAVKNGFLLTLRRLAERHELLPDRIVIREQIEVSDEMLAFGGLGSVRSGTYMGCLVAVKTARVPARGNLQKIRKVRINDILASRHVVSTVTLQRFYREVVLWGALSHPNILKLVGVQEDIGERQFITVSEWMVHGSIMDYIRNNHANRLELVRGLAFHVTSPTQTRQ